MIVGYREWILLRNELHPAGFTSNRGAWVPGVNVASHTSPMCTWDDSPHPCPDIVGSCGFYAFKIPSSILPMHPAEAKYGLWPRVFGAVAMWGRVVEHEHGYRAQYAMILVLEDHPLLHDKIFEVARRYDVPVAPYKER